MTREPICFDWLETFRREFPEEFPTPEKPAIEQAAQRAIEKNVAADRKQIERPRRSA
jgi:hypothetical protein